MKTSQLYTRFVNSPTHTLCWVLLFFIHTSLYAQEFSSLSERNQHIEVLARANDTTNLTKAFSEGNTWIVEEQLAAGDKPLLEFRMKETRHLVKYSKIAIDSGIARYQYLQQTARTHGHYDIETISLGRIANAYRSKRLMGEAFEYNQKEIDAANRSDNAVLVGRALITELDIAYNSLPWPIQSEDLDGLIEQGEHVIRYATQNNLNEILPFGKLYVSKFYIKQRDFKTADSILASISDAEPLPVAFSKYEHLCEIAKETDDLTKYRTYTLAFKTRAYKTKRPFVALNAHNYLLDYSLRADNADSARFYAQELERNLMEVDTTKYLDFLDVSYTTLARYYQERDVSKELQYLSYSAEINRIIAARQRVAFMAIRKYQDQVNDLEQTNTNLSDRNNFFKNNLVTLLGISILLLVTVFFLYRKYYRTRTKVAEIIVEKEQIAERVVKKSIELNNKQRVYLEGLKFIKADKNYVEFYTDEKRVIDRNKLSAVLTELPPNFIQVHRSYVINRNFIKSHNSTKVILHPDIEIPLSRTFKHTLKTNL